MTGKNIIVRVGKPTDNALLSELGTRTFLDTYAAHNTPEDIETYLAASFSPRIQDEKLADPLTNFLIAEIDAQPAGYAQLHLGIPPPEVTGRRPIEIERLYSDKPWIGHGVGAALMTACIELAKERDCDTIWLGVWEHNPRAIAFYQKWGFSVAGSHTFQLGGDIQNDLLMLRKTESFRVDA